ncbi:hypothetical protein RhiirA1_402464 [Rhizophagus irregularis]|uniref:DUF4218 domain-containing protein n=1 Tax=Rhizophagus irregularis TaxID=588596 RepID=A0A2N0QY67_9GLOM|nr:hypothetical protein RhiirA1_402464 [Rhizophagus irregularis]
MSNNNTKKSIADLLKPKKKYVYPCHCVLCKGAEVDPRTQEKHTRDNILWRSDDYDSRRNQMNAIAGRKQNKPNIILSVEKNLVGASSIKKRKRDDNQQILPIENSADSSIPNSFLSPIMSSSLATPKNPQPDTTTLDNMVNDASKPKTSYFHDPESNNENNNEYDNNNIWEMEYDVNDIYNINQEEESSPKNNSDNDDEEHHIYNIDQEGEDIPATRKLFGHGSAAMKCNRCEKRSTYSREYKKTHYGGMQDYNKWVTRPANPLLHRQYAHEWLRCFSKASREAHFKEHGIRWSELLRLPYMDPIRFAVVDPMYCLFLDVAKWIIKSIFINQNKLNMEQLHIAQNRMDHVDLPPDIGRIPPKIAIGNDGFSNLTADQWKTFIMIYSTTILWDMLDDNDRKILGHFVRACNLLVARFITEDDLKEAQERLKDMAYLIENTYGPEFITSNIHLALHIPDCCRDYGPIYNFWLFPFERLNGYIGSYPNSNWQIEPELMKIVLKNTFVDYHLSRRWSSGLLDESLYLLMPKKAVGSLALTAEREELQHFLLMRHNTSMLFKIYGTEPIPGQMLKPSYINVVMPLELRGFLCEWFSEGSRTHLLAYVKWYKPATTSATRFKHNFMESEVSNTELWKAEYFQKGSDSLLAVHRILCRAVKLKYVMKRPNQQNQQKYFSIVPLNRRFNL